MRQKEALKSCLIQVHIFYKVLKFQYKDFHFQIREKKEKHLKYEFTKTRQEKYFMWLKFEGDLMSLMWRKFQMK